MGGVSECATRGALRGCTSCARLPPPPLLLTGCVAGSLSHWCVERPSERRSGTIVYGIAMARAHMTPAITIAGSLLTAFVHDILEW